MDMPGAFVAAAKQCMVDQGLSQKRLAALSGVDQPTISRILNGAPHPPFESMVKIARALGKTVDDMVSLGEQSLSLERRVAKLEELAPLVRELADKVLGHKERQRNKR